MGELIHVVATVTKGGRLRLPKIVREQLEIEDGEQMVLYVSPEQSFFVAIPAEQAIQPLPVKLSGLLTQ